MSNIKIADLQTAGAEFFSDSETFLNNLTNDALMSVNGGFAPTVSVTSASVGLAGVSDFIISASVWLE